MTPINRARRNFLKRGAQSLLALPAASLVARSQAIQKSFASSDKSDQISAKPSRQVLTLNVKNLGATGDGVTRDTAAIQQTINRVFVLGGGVVTIPAGNYLIAPIELRTGVTIRFEKGATLTGSPNVDDYPVAQVRWEGKWVQGHLGLIYAMGAEHIAITGPGAIAGYTPPNVASNSQIKLRRPVLVELIGCTNVLLDGFSTSFHGMWSIHPVNCEQVSIRNLTIRSTGGNGDGIDVDSCRNVRIDGCDISTGDDCISLKSGRGSEGYLLHRPTEDVVISNCTFADSLFACIGIGSETSGGIRNVRIEHCKFTHAKSQAIYIKSHVGRGAYIRDITVDDAEVSGAEGGFLRLNLTTSGKQDEDPIPGLEGIPSAGNLRFNNIRVHDLPMLVEATECYAQKPVDGLSLTNITGSSAKGIALANIRNVEIFGVKITGYRGALIGVNNVTGKGINGAASIEAPRSVDPVAAPIDPYLLH